eukprot:c20022_g1_i5.p1 GENE.c20022_g1_i5~~c20022_g1_i5.p1  ORF type:complete len:114 (+),score=14.72 c20022_g1_i5:139-480(+)
MDDGSDFARTVVRRYRQSLQSLNFAVQSWNHQINNQQAISFIIQLGDLMDGFAIRNGTRDKDLATLMQAIEACQAPWYHVIGNHELYNFPRHELCQHPLFTSSFPNPPVSQNP